MYKIIIIYVSGSQPSLTPQSAILEISLEIHRHLFDNIFVVISKLYIYERRSKKCLSFHHILKCSSKNFEHREKRL